MFAYVGITKRYAPLNISAELMKINLEGGQLVTSVILPPPKFDLTHTDKRSTGGRQRGARGVKIYDSKVYVATHDSIICYDLELKNLINNYSCVFFNDIHEFLVNTNGFVVTCAHANSVVWMDHKSRVENVWYAPADPAVNAVFQELNFPIPKNDFDWRSVYFEQDPTHLNSISIGNEGETLVGFHKQGVLWNQTSGQIEHDGRFWGASLTHNHIKINDHYYINDTSSGDFIVFTPRKTIRINTSWAGICSQRPALLCSPISLKHGWLRGLAFLNHFKVLVGQCPASLLEIDINRSCISRRIIINDDWRWSVHGICVYPN